MRACRRRQACARKASTARSRWSATKPELPYHKPPLSKTFIKDAAAKPQILRAEAFYAGGRIELALGEQVEMLDPAGQAVAAGRRLGALRFDHAILATGSRPRALAIEGGPLAGVLSLRSLADARSIRDLAAEAEDVVILGGGFIGLEIAATLAAGGRRVTVVEAQDRLLARVVAPAVSSHVAARLAASGVRLLTRTTIARLEGENGHVAGVVTSAGERIAARMVIVGIGVVPNAELAAAAGLETANGIRVDGLMRTSAPGILAIGDAANYRHWQTGSDLRLESVQNATDQARLAARTVMGHADSYAGVPWFWSDIGDMKLQMVGLTTGSDRQVVLGEIGREQVLGVPFRRRTVSGDRDGEPAGRPHARPQDDGRRVFPLRRPCRRGQRGHQGRIRGMAEGQERRRCADARLKGHHHGSPSASLISSQCPSGSWK